MTSSPPSVRKLSIRANVGKCFRLSFQMLAFGDTILSRTGPRFGACLQRSTNVTGTGHTSRDFPSSRRDRIRPSAAMCRPSRPVPPRTGAKRALEAAFRRAVAVGGFVRSIRRAKSRPYHQFADGKDASVPSSIQRLQPASPGNLAVATASSRSAIPCCLRSPLRRQTRIQPKPQHRTME